MDLEILAFEMFKNEKSKNRRHLKDMIKKQFKSLTEKQLNEISLKICNYQIDKYGYNLSMTFDTKSKEELKRVCLNDRMRKYAKHKYYEKQGRR